MRSYPKPSCRCLVHSHCLVPSLATAWFPLIAVWFPLVDAWFRALSRWGLFNARVKVTGRCSQKGISSAPRVDPPPGSGPRIRPPELRVTELTLVGSVISEFLNVVSTGRASLCRVVTERRLWVSVNPPGGMADVVPTRRSATVSKSQDPPHRTKRRKITCLVRDSTHAFANTNT